MNTVKPVYNSLGYNENSLLTKAFVRYKRVLTVYCLIGWYNTVFNATNIEIMS
jgi:hypothetical protein